VDRARRVAVEAFGTARRLKADVAEGVALVFGRLAVRRAGSVGLVAFGSPTVRVLPPRGSKPGIVALRRALADGVARDGCLQAEGLADALRRAARRPASQGWWSRSPISAISTAGSGRWDRCACDIRSWRSRSQIRTRPSSRRQGAWRSWTRRPVLGSRSTPHELECAGALPSSSGRRTLVARELRKLQVDHVVLSTGEDWLPALGRQLMSRTVIGHVGIGRLGTATPTGRMRARRSR